MATEVATAGLPLGGVVGIVTHHSGWTQSTFGEVPEKVDVPSAPVIDSMAAPTESAGIIELSLTLPTTDADGNALAQSEIVKVRMHHSTSSGVDTDDSFVDFPPGVTLTWTPGDVVTHYAAVRVQDTHDHWSALSNEKSAAANDATTPPEDDGLWAHRLGKDADWTEDSPDTNSVAWANVVLYWKDSAYTIADGNTNKTYIWWDYDVSTTTFQTSDTVPTLSFEDVLVASTDAGKLYLTMYSPMVITDFLRTGVMQSTNWTTTTGSYFDLDAGTIKLGGSSDPSFAVDTDGLLTSKAGVIASFTISEAEGLYAGAGVTRVQMKPGVGIWMGATAWADAAATFRVSMAGAVNFGTDLTWDLTELIMLGTMKTANSGERIALYGASAGDAHKLIAYDATGKRIAFNEAEIRIYKSDTTTTLSVFPSTPATVAFIGNDELIVNNTLIVGRDTDPATTDILHVTGDVLFTGDLLVGDHGESTTPRVVNAVFYTSTPPTASDTPRGTLAFKVPV